MIDIRVISANARTFPSRRELNPDVQSERQVQQARLPPRLPTATSTVPSLLCPFSCVLDPTAHLSIIFPFLSPHRTASCAPF